MELAIDPEVEVELGEGRVLVSDLLLPPANLRELFGDFQCCAIFDLFKTVIFPESLTEGRSKGVRTIEEIADIVETASWRESNRFCLDSRVACGSCAFGCGLHWFDVHWTGIFQGMRGSLETFENPSSSPNHCCCDPSPVESDLGEKDWGIHRI